MQNFDGRIVGSYRINFDEILESRFEANEMEVRGRLELLGSMERAKIDRLEKLRKERLENLRKERSARPDRRRSVVLGIVGREVSVAKEF